MQKNFLRFIIASLIVGLLTISFFACGDSGNGDWAASMRKAATKALAAKKAAYNKEVQKILKQYADSDAKTKKNSPTKAKVNTVAEIKVGDKALVPKWEWHLVKNPDGIKNGNAFFEFNKTCGIEEGGIMEVIGFTGDDLVVKYSAPNFFPTIGTPCPCGTVFILKRAEFSAMTKEYKKIAEAREKEKKAIASILKKK